MAKYRVYLKDGKGIFDVDADCFDNPFDNPSYIDFSKNESTVACFERESIYAIINKNGAVRIDNNMPFALNADDIRIVDAGHLPKELKKIATPHDEKQMSAWVDMLGEKTALIDCLLRVENYRYDVECIKRELAALREEMDAKKEKCTEGIKVTWGGDTSC